MRRIELDFLRRKPVMPGLSWLLLIAGAAFLSLVSWQYRLVQAEMKTETARAAQLAREAKLERMRQSPRTAQVEPGLVDQALLDRPWGDLFLGLERSRPAKIALLDLEADGRKSQVTLIAEAKTPGQMLDYINELRKQPGLAGVTLTSHIVDEENPQRPVQFSVRFNWSQP
jgi:Tfp pilus assembly protein PilN